MPRSFVFVLVLLMVSLGLNVTLALKVKGMAPHPAPDNKIGIQAAPFTATDLQGHTTDVSFNIGKPTLIYYIDPQCRWCRANATNFDILANALAQRVRVVILSTSTEKMDQFLADTHPPDNSVLIVKSPEIIRVLGLTATPQTFLVNSAGRVEHHWVGAYDHQNRTEIEKLFNVHLLDTKAPS